MCHFAAAAAKSLQLCPTLCDPIDGSPPGSPVPGIPQARTLEWVSISFSNAWKWKVKVKSLSRVRLLATPWTVAYQAPLSMGFSRQEYWSGLPLPSPVPLWNVNYFELKSINLEDSGNTFTSPLTTWKNLDRELMLKKKKKKSYYQRLLFKSERSIYIRHSKHQVTKHLLSLSCKLPSCPLKPRPLFHSLSQDGI